MSKAPTEEGINGSVKLQSLPGFCYGTYDTPTLWHLRMHPKRPMFRWRAGLLLGHDE
jgi:hypothetical protein